MTLRTRLRRALTRGSHDEGTGPRPLNKIHSWGHKKEKVVPDPNVYQPGEKMPPLKYRRPVDPLHKKHLESFDFASAWRRRSDHSIYSPMGSRMPSRKTSATTLGRRSIGGRSLRRKSSSRDDACVDSGFGGSISGDTDFPEGVREGSDEEGDVTNVGLSRHPTQDPRSPSSAHPVHHSQSINSSNSRPGTASDRGGPSRLSSTTARREQPFRPEDLEAALKVSHLEMTKEESDRSRSDTPDTTDEKPRRCLRNSI
ncbi:hypothetical protein B0J11DRAFT_270310 [Dendryphion nanum]|uniref:Uncharacterized protein n=1 Tax=Dendryphion nanum TaxID=256645 RepID=A0A9P9DZ37_9PLEO|nr:hypothetical protein B0J11DRAFT_270310 [Dendryphion nanum]